MRCFFRCHAIRLPPEGGTPNNISQGAIRFGSVRRYALALVVCACLSPQAPAQGVSGPRFSENRTYDLGSLIELGLSSTPSTRAAWLHARAASAAVGEARAPYYPKITAQFEGGSDQWYTPAANAPDNFRREQATTVLSLEFLLLDFGRRAADVKATVAAFDAAGLAYERQLQEVVFAVQSAYFRHEAALARDEAVRRLREAAAVASKTTEKEVASGLAARPASLDAKRRLLEADYECESAAAGVQITLGNLCVAAGLPANTALRLASSQPGPTDGIRQKAGALIASALAARPDLAARAADVRAREAAVERAKADFLPEVRLEGKYAYSAFGYAARAGRTEGTYAEDLNGYGAFLVAKWDLFDGFERVAREKRKKAEAAAAREDLESARLETTQEVWVAYQENLRSASRIEFSEALVASAKENDEAVQAAYRGGLASVAELTEAASQLAMAKSTQATALAEYSTSLAALSLAIGSAPDRPKNRR